jgi:hypothetical protein
VLVAAERPTVLRGRSLPVGSVRRDHLDPPVLPQSLVQSIAVVGTIADQSVGGVVEKAAVPEYISALVHRASLDQRQCTEGLLDRLAQRFRAIDHKHQRPVGREPPFHEVYE